MEGKEGRNGKRGRRLRVYILAFSVGTIGGLLFCYFYNNISIQGDQRFTEKLDRAITKAAFWTADNEPALLGGEGFINIALLRMLQDCHQLRSTYAFEHILDRYLTSQVRPSFKKNILDPDWPIEEKEINDVFKTLAIDYQWETYALAPAKVASTAQDLDLFNPDRWQGRQLTHQLWALVLYRERNACGPEIDDLIEHLCGRLASELDMDLHVVDIYIQKVAFVLKAGHPEMIKRRWIERIIANLNLDGGWDDRSLCFTSGRRPRFGKARSDQHASIQALWVLYQVRYRYPEVFRVQSGLAEI